jgi:hypothetical protein
MVGEVGIAIADFVEVALPQMDLDLTGADELEATKPHEEEERQPTMTSDPATASSGLDIVDLAQSATIHTT